MTGVSDAGGQVTLRDLHNGATLNTEKKAMVLVMHREGPPQGVRQDVTDLQRLLSFVQERREALARQAQNTKEADALLTTLHRELAWAQQYLVPVT